MLEEKLDAVVVAAAVGPYGSIRVEIGESYDKTRVDVDCLISWESESRR